MKVEVEIIGLLAGELLADAVPCGVDAAAHTRLGF
jgi:hypothetical protein